MLKDKPESFPVPLFCNWQKLQPNEVIPLLLNQYPIVVSSDAQTPYDYFSAPKGSSIAIGGYSPTSTDRDGDQLFHTNPLSHPEVARLFAEAKGWNFIPAPEKVLSNRGENIGYVRKIPFETLVSILKASTGHHHNEQEPKYIENVNNDLKTWEEFAKYLDVLSITARSHLGSPDFDLVSSIKPQFLNRTIPGLKENPTYGFSFKIGSGFMDRATEISRYNAQVVSKIPTYLFAADGRSSSDLLDKSLAREVVDLTNAVLGPDNRARVNFSSEQGNEQSFFHLARDGYVNRNDSEARMSIPEMYSSVADSVEVLYHAVKEVTETAIKRHRTRRDTLLSGLQARIAAKPTA